MADIWYQKKSHSDSDHTDDRRTIVTIFNGEDFDGDRPFAARGICLLTLQRGITHVFVLPSFARKVIYVLTGSGIFGSWSFPYFKRFSAGTKLVIPPGVSYSFDASRTTILLYCSEHRLESLLPGSQNVLVDSGVQWQQVKIAYLKQESVMGNHYHLDYDEMYAMTRGQSIWSLKDLHSDGEGTQVIFLTPGGKLIVPKGRAHVTRVSADGILIGASQKQYVSAVENDIRFEMQAPEFPVA